jgi:class 3 adenylate cyclase
MVECSSCGARSAGEARFCASCGTRLISEPVAPARDQRKTVTAVFTDLVGSTALASRLDPEALRALMSRYYEAMRVPVERHGGRVDKFIGDAVVAFFGVPVARLLERGDVYTAAGETNLLLGRDGAAREAFTKAIELYEAKGAVPMVELTRARLAGLGA